MNDPTFGDHSSNTEQASNLHEHSCMCSALLTAHCTMKHSGHIGTHSWQEVRLNEPEEELFLQAR